MQIDSVSQNSSTATAQRPRQMPADVQKAVADKLGMSTDELKSELSSGKKLADIAKEKGVDMKDLHSTIQQALQKDGISGTGGGHHHHHHAAAPASSDASAPAPSLDPSVGQQVDVQV
jgi:hypothetical protein